MEKGECKNSPFFYLPQRVLRSWSFLIFANIISDTIAGTFVVFFAQNK